MFDAFIERQDRTIRGNRILIVLRLLLATVCLAVLIFLEVEKPYHPIEPVYFSPPGLVAIIVCALTILYLVAAQRYKNSPLAAKLAFFQIFVDIFLISALVWNTGGVKSQFVVLYLISICSAAFVLKWNVAILAAALGATLFSLTTLLYSVDVIPNSYRTQITPFELTKLHNLQALDFLRLLLLPVFAFFLTGFLAGSLSRRLANAKLLHDEILEGIGEGILVLDRDHKALYYNREFQRMVDRKTNLQNLSLDQLLGAAIDTQATEVLNGNTIRRIEISHQRADGITLPLSIRMIPISDPDATVAHGLILALDDITAEKKMEELLRHRQRVETMGNISATIAHEIRNPLASIRGAVQEIGRSLTIPENKKILLDIVLSESDRLDQIITDFLRFARMRAPTFMIADIIRVLADIKALLLSRPEAKNTQIEVSGDGIAPFSFDTEQLRQVFLNLGLNALQAMEGQSQQVVTIRVSAVSLYRVPGFPHEQISLHRDRPGILIEFSDTGPGISASTSSQIFEPFFTTKATGTGLGLAIVERIVHSHEGLITFTSKIGCGTTFRIWLPGDLKVGAALSGLMPAVRL